jgi:hypothetical protein
MDEMVEILGILSLFVFVFTVFSGFAMKYKRDPLFKIHRVAGYAALALAAAHGISAIFS